MPAHAEGGVDDDGTRLADGRREQLEGARQQHRHVSRAGVVGRSRSAAEPGGQQQQGHREQAHRARGPSRAAGRSAASRRRAGRQRGCRRPDGGRRRRRAVLGPSRPFMELLVLLRALLALLRSPCGQVSNRPARPGETRAWRRGRGVRAAGRSGSGWRPRRTAGCRPEGVGPVEGGSDQPGQHLLGQLGERALLVGQVGLPGLRVPDLDPGTRADDDALLVQPGVLAQRRRDGRPGPACPGSRRRPRRGRAAGSRGPPCW